MLRSPIVTVILATDDGQEQITVQTDNRNQVKYDLFRANRGWPDQKTAPTIWLTVVAWHALALAKHLAPDTSFEAFNERCLEVFPSDEEGNRLNKEQLEERAGIKVDPTQPAPAAGS